MRQSKLVSWVFFALSAGLLGFVVWSRFLATPPRGEWQDQLAGALVGSLPVTDAQGRDLGMAHPAVLYFYSDNCRFCPPAAAQINSFVASHGTGGLPIYALTNYGRVPSGSTQGFGPSIQVIRLTRTTTNLNFVKEVPLLVRTDAGGRIQRAYVGIADDSVLAAMLAPREAGPVAR